MRRREHHAPLTRGQAGFTLIELLIVILIASFIMVGMVGMFRANRTAFSMLDQMRNLEENGRVAADFVGRELRPAKAGSFLPLDNGDPNYGAAQTALGAKNGTDILRIFVSVLAIDPIYLGTGFNNTSANLKFDTHYMTGFPGYDPAMSNNAISDLLGQYVALIYNCGSELPHLPTSYADGGGDCTQDITPTGSGPTGPDTKIVYNRGNDNANRPHQCDTPDTSPAIDNTKPVCVSIGGEAYFYVRPADPGDTVGVAVPQLVKYDTALGTHEVIANNVEDLQIEYGVDTTADGVIDQWVDGRFATEPTQVMAVRLQYLMVTTSIDNDKAAEAPPFLSNSSIDTTGVADQKRRRVISRTVRLRNAS